MAKKREPKCAECGKDFVSGEIVSRCPTCTYICGGCWDSNKTAVCPKCGNIIAPPGQSVFVKGIIFRTVRPMGKSIKPS